jgi:hypothetical protein
MARPVVAGGTTVVALIGVYLVVGILASVLGASAGAKAVPFIA